MDERALFEAYRAKDVRPKYGPPVPWDVLLRWEQRVWEDYEQRVWETLREAYR